jgi:hypothetical protein
MLMSRLIGMTNYVHLIAIMQNEQLLSELIRDFKSFTAK